VRGEDGILTNQVKTGCAVGSRLPGWAGPSVTELHKACSGNGDTKRAANLLRGPVTDKDFDMESDWITALGKARGDEYTEKILAFVQELEKSAPEPFLPLLTDLALARTLIVHLVIRYGPERGMAEARDAFESTLEQIKPILERMKSRKGPPKQ
jgi:hypothetical protein